MRRHWRRYASTSTPKSWVAHLKGEGKRSLCGFVPAYKWLNAEPSETPPINACRMCLVMIEREAT